LNFLIVPKNFAKLSPSSNPALKVYKLVKISIKFAIIREKIATPKRRTNAPITLSRSLLGAKSPNPTVESEVKAKYIFLSEISSVVSSIRL